MDFEPITTQEKLDELLAAERAKFEGYASPENVAEYEKRIKTLTDKAAKLEKTNAELDSANKAHELNALKNKVARESGLRYELADRLSGTTEEELRADAQKLAEYTAVTAPLKSTESSADKLSAAMQRGAAAMFGGEE
jgi:alanyl-tRNA synthetase